MDGVIVIYENASYPKKTNKGFYELLYVLEGSLTIELPDQVVSLEVGDMFIIQPDVEQGKHIAVGHLSDLGEPRCTKGLKVTYDPLASLLVTIPQRQEH